MRLIVRRTKSKKDSPAKYTLRDDLELSLLRDTTVFKRTGHFLFVYGLTSSKMHRKSNCFPGLRTHMDAEYYTS